MHGAAGRVEQLQGARVAQLDGRWGRLVGLHQQVLAALAQASLTAGGVEPQPAEGVVDQELHHVAGGEELVAHRQLAAVARRLAGVAHRLALFLGVEVLVDPADGLVFGPQRLDLGVVDQRQQRQERRLAREQPPLGRVAVEQAGQVLGQLVEDAEQVGAIGVAGFAQAGAGQTGIELEALGLVAVADRLDQQTPRLGHAQRSQAVEDGEGLLADDAVQHLRLRAPPPAGLGREVVSKDLPQDLGGLQSGVVQVGELGDVRHLAGLGVHPVVPLELTSELLGQQVAGLVDETLESIAGALVERHGFGSRYSRSSLSSKSS